MCVHTFCASQSLPAPEPPSDQLHHQHLSHVLHALQTSWTTFKHNADTVSTFSYSLRSEFLGKGVLTHGIAILLINTPPPSHP